jgi:hypothetical protein
MIEVMWRREELGEVQIKEVSSGVSQHVTLTPQRFGRVKFYLFYFS